MGAKSLFQRPFLLHKKIIKKKKKKKKIWASGRGEEEAINH